MATTRCCLEYLLETILDTNLPDKFSLTLNRLFFLQMTLHPGLELVLKPQHKLTMLERRLLVSITMKPGICWFVSEDKLYKNFVNNRNYYKSSGCNLNLTGVG